MNEIMADKVVTVGDGPYFAAANSTYYLDEAGNRFSKAGEIEGKYTARAEVLVQITIPEIFKTGVELVDAACLHSLTRTLQERVQIVGRQDNPDWQAEAEAFLRYHQKKVMHERTERVTAAKADTDETLALRTLITKVLKLKTDEQLAGASVPVEPFERTTKGYNDAAKKMKAAGHPWFVKILSDIKKSNADKYV